MCDFPVLLHIDEPIPPPLGKAEEKAMDHKVGSDRCQMPVVHIFFVFLFVYVCFPPGCLHEPRIAQPRHGASTRICVVMGGIIWCACASNVSFSSGYASLRSASIPCSPGAGRDCGCSRGPRPSAGQDPRPHSLWREKGVKRKQSLNG